ncbi:peptidylprolyl isomerase [Stappia sp. GBMRC 2046]|uniref:Peptidylprolyl isomerase n=2 Tax=Stappia sediminis TaxID=2692190 RepID=A0A7X3LSV0_9HYPH|nr:peptidylprolyl isomerase [Stappia sediminis]
MNLMHWFRLTFLLLVFAGFAGAPAHSATKIEVIVNDKAITNYDVDQRAKLIRLTSRRSGSAARKAALEELVDETLQLQEANRLNISVSQSQVDSAFADIARNVKLSTDRLSAALRQQGVSPNTLKDRLRAQIAWGEAVRLRFRAEVNISDADIIAALREQESKNTNKSVEYSLQQFVFVIPSKASNSFKAQRKREVDQFRSRFTSCDEAKRIADGLKEVVTMPARRLLESEIPPNLREKAKQASVGRVADVNLGEKGYEVTAICDKREFSGSADARAALEVELRAKEGEQLSRQYLRDLRRRALIDYR